MHVKSSLTSAYPKLRCFYARASYYLLHLAKLSQLMLDLYLESYAKSFSGHALDRTGSLNENTKISMLLGNGKVSQPFATEKRPCYLCNKFFDILSDRHIFEDNFLQYGTPLACTVWVRLNIKIYALSTLTLSCAVVSINSATSKTFS